MSEKTKTAEPKPPEPVVIPHAYTIMEDPAHPGFYHALHLENVVAEKVHQLEPSGRSSYPLFQLNRVKHAMDIRQHNKDWKGKK